MRPVSAARCLLPLLLLAGCAALESETLPPGAVACTDPRPQICTMDYTPVCARHSSGESVTYANACGACADQRVLYHLAGACAE